jgi:hypothetical protein
MVQESVRSIRTMIRLDPSGFAQKRAEKAGFLCSPRGLCAAFSALLICIIVLGQRSHAFTGELVPKLTPSLLFERILVFNPDTNAEASVFPRELKILLACQEMLKSDVNNYGSGAIRIYRRGEGRLEIICRSCEIGEWNVKNFYPRFIRAMVRRTNSSIFDFDGNDWLLPDSNPLNRGLNDRNQLRPLTDQHSAGLNADLLERSQGNEACAESGEKQSPIRPSFWRKSFFPNALRFFLGWIFAVSGGRLIYDTGAGCTWKRRRVWAVSGTFLYFIGCLALFSPIPWFR